MLDMPQAIPPGADWVTMFPHLGNGLVEGADGTLAGSELMNPEMPDFR